MNHPNVLLNSIDGLFSPWAMSHNWLRGESQKYANVICEQPLIHLGLSIEQDVFCTAPY